MTENNQASPDTNEVDGPFSFEMLTRWMAGAAQTPYEKLSADVAEEGADHSSADPTPSLPVVALTGGDRRFTLRLAKAAADGEGIQLFTVAGGRATPLNLGQGHTDTAVMEDGLRAAEFELGQSKTEAGGFAVFTAALFSAIGPANHYGASARPVVVSTLSGDLIEIPAFSEFYFEQTPADSALIAYAAVDSPSLTGAFRFEFSPAKDHERENASIAVTARLFFRREVAQLGVAPLVSMFLFSDANRGAFDDYRPQVHDSDGLWVKTADALTSWRPLTNPSQLANSYLGQPTPSAFGVLQRAREFILYQDDERRYDLKPSVVVEPLDDWGRGYVRLIETPTRTETTPNVTAFWMPQATFAAGQSVEFRYRLTWGNLASDSQSQAIVRATRSGLGGL